MASPGNAEPVHARAMERGTASVQLPLRRMNEASHRIRVIAVPLMLFVSSMLMALAWLGHLRFSESPFLFALAACWLIVLPEYLLNITAIRFGWTVYSGAAMASFNLCSGVVCVALVSRFVLDEVLRPQQLVGFALMVAAMALIGTGRPRDEDSPREVEA